MDVRNFNLPWSGINKIEKREKKSKVDNWNKRNGNKKKKRSVEAREKEWNRDGERIEKVEIKRLFNL